MNKKTTVLLLLIGFLVSMYAPITYANQCFGYQNGYVEVDDKLEYPFENKEALNVYVADFRNWFCGLKVRYRDGWIIETEHGLLTKKDDWHYSKWYRMVYVINLSTVQYDKKGWKKRADKNVWDYVDKYPVLMMAIPGCEIEDLLSGKILRTSGDGSFISNKFTVTQLK